MMRPERLARIPGRTPRPSSTGLLTKNSSCATWSSHATSLSGASGCGPVALSTSTSTGPRLSATRATRSAACRSSVTSAVKASATPARIPDGRDDLERPRVTADIVDGHGQAVAGEAPRDGAARPAGAARYEGDAVPQRLQPCVRLRPAGGAQSVPGVGVGGCAHVNAVDCASRVLRATPHYTTRSAPTLPAVQAASYVINAAEVEHQPWGFRFPAR